MQNRRFQRTVVSAVISATVVMLGGLGTVYADSAQSTHYKVNETQFGIGGSQGNCSDEYCADMSAGDTAVGRTSSDNYGAHAGFLTTDQPYLDVWTEGGTAALGTLDPGETATATNLIKVRNYLSGGYIMQVTGSPPSQGTHALEAITTPSTSQPGAEQFGINLADNTSPDVGAEAVQIPDAWFSFGYATEDYLTPDLFKYADGDIIAASDRASGETDYTLSMIINISNVTPGGKYLGSFSAVVVPVY